MAKMHTKDSLYHFLQENNINYQAFDHPPVHTCSDANNLPFAMDGLSTKHLFLKEEKGDRYFLLITTSEKRINLKGLAEILRVKRLSFGSPEKLEAFLGVKPGAVTILATINDTGRLVLPLIDPDVLAAGLLQCHPLVNTSTVVIAADELKRFYEVIGRELTEVKVPSTTPFPNSELNAT